MTHYPNTHHSGSDLSDRRNRIVGSTAYCAVSSITRLMDRYYLDPIIGLIPGGWGDTLSAIMLLPFLWLSVFVVRSFPLTLAIIYNALRDMVVGLIPFFIGDILDVFSRSYRQNMDLIQGFVDHDKATIHEVNRKAWFFAGAILLCLAVIYLLIKLTIALMSQLLSW